MLRGRVEPYETGTWRFWCECGGEDTANPKTSNGCTRIVNDSEPNFRCEAPIREPSQKPCMILHQLAPLVEAYTAQKAKDDAMAFLASMEAKKQEAMKTLGISEAEYNAMKSPTVSTISQPVEEA